MDGGLNKQTFELRDEGLRHYSSAYFFFFLYILSVPIRLTLPYYVVRPLLSSPYTHASFFQFQSLSHPQCFRSFHRFHPITYISPFIFISSNYLRQGCYVFTCICSFVFFSFLHRDRKYYEFLTTEGGRGGTRTMKEAIYFRV